MLKIVITGGARMCHSCKGTIPKGTKILVNVIVGHNNYVSRENYCSKCVEEVLKNEFNSLFKITDEFGITEKIMEQVS